MHRLPRAGLLAVPAFMKLPALLALCMVLACARLSAEGPDPAEVPLPPIATPLGRLPGVNELPGRAAHRRHQPPVGCLAGAPLILFLS